MGKLNRIREGFPWTKHERRACHSRVSVPKDVWTYVKEKKSSEHQKIVKKGDVGLHIVKITNNGIENVCEIEIRADSRSSLSKALKAVHKLNNGIVVRRFKDVSKTDEVWSDYPELLVQDAGEGVVVVGPEQDVMTFENLRIRSQPESSCMPLATFNAERGQKIHVRREDITKMRVDVIVNAANEQLQNNGGVALAISRAAGPELHRECDQYIGKYGNLQVTQVTVTRGYKLPARHVIHVVGPRWNKADGRECTENLYQAFINCLNQAANLKASSMSLPAISSGIFGVPPEVVTEQMCRAVLEFCRTESSITDIYLVDINPQIPEMVARYLDNNSRVTKEIKLDSDLNKTVPLASGHPTSGRGPPGAHGTTNSGYESDEASGEANMSGDKASNVGRRDPVSRSPRLSPVTFITKSGQRIHARRDDITKMRVDVIVSAINQDLKHNGGVAKTISEAAGPELQQEYDQHQVNGSLGLGGVTVTRGYKLPASHVIHVVEPPWDEKKCRRWGNNICKAYETCLNQAATMNISSIAIPANSSGLHGAPTAVLTEQMCRAVLDFCRTESSITDIYLVDINPEIPNLTARQLVDRGTKQKRTNEPQTCTGIEKDGTLLDAEPASHAKSSWDSHGTKNKPKAKRKRTLVQQKDTNEHLPQSQTTQSDDIRGPAGFPGVSGSIFKKKVPVPFNPENYPQQSDMHHTFTKKLLTTVLISTARNCAICMNTLSRPETLPCGHKFCKECIDDWMQEKPTCPCCNKVFGKLTGNQPMGTMVDTVIDVPLPGYGGYGTIQIDYSFPNGTQQKNHPKPGHPYAGTSLRAYLPDSPEGREVLALLRKAFDARLLFTIGRSLTPGLDDHVVWNDVHHKTNRDGGPDLFGYPDFYYLDRVKAELKAKGIE